MGTITGTLSQLGTRTNNSEYHNILTKNKRTINVIYIILRNNKKNIKKLGTKIKDFGQGFRV